MNYGKGMYTLINKGQYHVGLSKASVHEISSSKVFLESGLQESFLLASVPGHTVNVDNVYVSDKLVTVQDYELFIEKSGYVTEAETDGWGWTWDNGWKKEKNISWINPTGTQLDEFYQKQKEFFPVMQVSNNDAVSYCEWYSRERGKKILLPDEKELEIFAGMKAVKKIHADQSVPVDEQSLENYFKKIWEFISHLENFSPVGMLWEWTDSWYTSYPGGEGNKEFGNVYKVLKGGSFFCNAVQRMPQYRFRRCPTARSPFYGFRFAIRNNG